MKFKYLLGLSSIALGGIASVGFVPKANISIKHKMVSVVSGKNPLVKTKNSPSNLNKWTEAKNGNNITDGFGGFMFLDSKGNLWAAGKGSNLQVLRQGKTQWEDAGHGNKIKDGNGGFMVEDDDGNLWAAGNGSNLQLLRQGKTQWEDAGHGNNMIANNFGRKGAFGSSFFKDSKGNLWSLTGGSDLQVLRKGQTEWEIASKDGNKIFDGEWGFIFEDSKGNLWTAGNNSNLQVLRKGKSKWEDAGHGNKIKDGMHGFIFEDSKGNLWAAGKDTGLQVLRNGESEWEDAGHGNMINDKHGGYGGFMLEDSQGNLWAEARLSPLQVLRKGKSKWEAAGHGIKNKFGINGYGYGTDPRNVLFFEDSIGNLWFSELSTKTQSPGLQVLRKGETEWGFAKNGDNFKSGSFGFMFEDNNKKLWAAGDGTPLQSLQLTKNNIPKVKKDSKPVIKPKNNSFKWNKAGNGSNIKDGAFGYMMEDSDGNLWAAGKDTKLQVLRKGKTKWEAGITLPKNGLEASMPEPGDKGFIFEDSKGNLWAAKNDSFLTVKNKNQKFWIPALKKSTLKKIENKDYKFDEKDIISWNDGFMFEDSKGNLWSSGSGRRLQVLRKDETGWEDAGNGSNITDGNGGFMFEDKKGNLWSAGYHEVLQVLRKDKTSWEDAGNGSNIVNGNGGFMFEDSKENLWAAGFGTGLQVLRKDKTTWEVAGHGNNMKNGSDGYMLEDSNGNLWAAANGAKLQVLRKGKTMWEDAGHNIYNVLETASFLFEDSEGNLWFAEQNSGLQVLEKGKENWEFSGGGNKLHDGWYGFMFEDSEGNLWSAGHQSGLQVTKLSNNSKKIINNSSKQGGISKKIKDKSFINTPGGIVVIVLSLLVGFGAIGSLSYWVFKMRSRK